MQSQSRRRNSHPFRSWGWKLPLIIVLTVGSYWLADALKKSAILTAAAVLATSAYTLLTLDLVISNHSLSKTSQDQVAELRRQLAHAREEADRRGEATRVAQEHATQLFRESIRARLDSLAPLVTMAVTDFGMDVERLESNDWVGGDPFGGTYAEETWETLRFALWLKFGFSNHGPGPATFFLPSPPLHDYEMGSFEGKTPIISRYFLVEPGEKAQITWRYTAGPAAWRHQVMEGFSGGGVPDNPWMLKFEVTNNPAIPKSVFDTHRWQGEFQPFNEDGTSLIAQPSRIINASATATVERTYPGLENNDQ